MLFVRRCSAVVNLDAHAVVKGRMKETIAMYKAKSKKVCEHPDKLKGKPEECTPEQIEVCHGQTKQHPCVQKK